MISARGLGGCAPWIAFFCSGALAAPASGTWTQQTIDGQAFVVFKATFETAGQTLRAQAPLGDGAITLTLENASAALAAGRGSGLGKLEASDAAVAAQWLTALSVAFGRPAPAVGAGVRRRRTRPLGFSWLLHGAVVRLESTYVHGATLVVRVDQHAGELAFGAQARTFGSGDSRSLDEQKSDRLTQLATTLRDGVPAGIRADAGLGLTNEAPLFAGLDWKPSRLACASEEQLSWTPSDLVCATREGAVQHVAARPALDFNAANTLRPAPKAVPGCGLVFIPYHRPLLAPGGRRLLLESNLADVHPLPDHTCETINDRRALVELDLATRKETWGLQLASTRLQSSWSSDGATLLVARPETSGKNTGFELYDAKTHRVLERVEVPGRVTSGFHRDGRWQFKVSGYEHNDAPLDLPEAPPPDSPQWDELTQQSSGGHYDLSELFYGWVPREAPLRRSLALNDSPPAACRLEYDPRTRAISVDGEPMPPVLRRFSAQVFRFFENEKSLPTPRWLGPCHLLVTDGDLERGERPAVLNLRTGAWRYLFPDDFNGVIFAVRSDLKQALVAEHYLGGKVALLDLSTGLP